MLFSKTSILAMATFLAMSALSLDPLPARAAEKSPARAEAKSKGAMHQVDFILAHASCPSCILKVRAALRATAGVVKCEIALRKPYGGVFIYEPGKVDLAKLKAVATQADPNHVVDMTEVKEKTVTEVPHLLVPYYMFKGNVPEVSQ
jgi:hypothetical protein